MIHKRTTQAFTLVELMIVIIIIGILAAVTIVSYNAVQNNSISTGLQSDLNNVSDLLRVDQANSATGIFPTTLALANSGTGVPASPGTTYTYVYNNTNTPRTFCVTATRSGQNYHITQEGKPQPSPCPILDFDLAVPTSYPGTGTTINDLSGNGYKGTMSAGVDYVTTNGGASSFDGVSLDNVTISGIASVVTTNFTAEAWINSPNTSVDQTIVSRNGPFFMRISASKFRVGIYTGTWVLTTGSKVLSNNTWHHLVLTYDNSYVKSYVDGVQDLNIAKTGTMAVLTSATIGYPAGAGEQFVMNGLVGAVRLYDKALSASDVSKNFNAARSRYGL